MVESLQREVEQLEEKLAELGGSVREGGAGARSLEAVRKEAEDESLSLSYSACPKTSGGELSPRSNSVVSSRKC